MTKKQRDILGYSEIQLPPKRCLACRKSIAADKPSKWECDHLESVVYISPLGTCKYFE